MVSLLASVSLLADDQVLLTINGKPITVSEFTYLYEKNNQNSPIEDKSLDEYLELVIKYKLKAAEAESQGIDTTEAFQKEFMSYRAQATPKYLRDEAAVDSLVRMTYDRMCRNRRAAHIAIQCPMNASPEAEADSLARIKEALARVTTGLPTKKSKKPVAEPFEKVAREVSTDPSVEQNGGELGWITPLRYVFPFEEAVYTTPVGQISKVFRTPYGFHIVYVEEELPMQELNAAHIMKMVPREDEEAAAQMKVVIDSIYARLLAGEDFATVARECSDDKGSAYRGGELGWFGRGRMVKSFEDTAYKLEVGEMSKPFRSEYGWHIILMQDKRGAQPLDSLYETIYRNISRNERMQEADKSFIQKTRIEYGLSADMSDEEVLQYADSQLENKYEDFRNLVQEYHDGLLLFEVSLKEVWDKASQDVEGLSNYFKNHKKDFTWNAPRFKGYIVYCKDETIAKAARAIIKSSNPDSVQSYLNQRINLDGETYVKATRGLWERGKNTAVDKYGFNDKTAQFTPTEELPVVFAIGKVIKQPQEYMDERSKVTTAYQDELEIQWVKKLREKFPVVINQDVLESLKQH